MSIAVIAGLGNPGSEYEHTRHNIGFVVVDRLAALLQADWKRDAKHNAYVAKATCGEHLIALLKPQTYMNDSGVSLASYARFHKIKPDRMLVIYDDTGLDCGRTKLSLYGGSGGHNGVESIFQHIGAGIIRYRVGIGAKSNPAMDLKNYVLKPFSKYERQLLDCRMPDFLSDLKLIIDNGVVHGMNRINKKAKKAKSEETTDESDNDKEQV